MNNGNYTELDLDVTCYDYECAADLIDAIREAMESNGKSFQSYANALLALEMHLRNLNQGLRKSVDELYAAVREEKGAQP